MRLRNNIKESNHDSPDNIWLNQLSHHYVAPHSGFHNAIPDPSSVPSVASTALEYIDEEAARKDIYAKVENVDPRLMPRLEDDSDMDYTELGIDPLRHAGVFTTEEAARIYLEKLKNLKSLYECEYTRLFHIMRENRRQYLHDVKLEKETMMSVHGQPKETELEKQTYQELKSLSRYHSPQGVESILLQYNREKRSMLPSESNSHKNSTPIRCSYAEGSWRCTERSVPATRHCFKHILQDPNQVLFQMCGAVQDGEEECLTPVIPLPFMPTCIYHTSIPDLLPISKSTTSSSHTNHKPEVVNLSDSSVLIVSEMPPDDVMEGDSTHSAALNVNSNGRATRSTRKRKILSI